MPSDAPIVQGLERMRESEHRGIQKLFDVAYYTAKQGRPLTDFESLIALKKTHGEDFLGTSYENWKSCRNFLLSISDYFFEKNVYDKISRSNFITIMFDGTTDSAVSEQGVIFFGCISIQMNWNLECHFSIFNSCMVGRMPIF